MVTIEQVNEAYAKDVEAQHEAEHQKAKSFLKILIGLTPIILFVAAGGFFPDLLPIVVVLGLLCVGALSYTAYKMFTAYKAVSETWKPLMKEFLVSKKVDLDSMKPSIEEYSNVPTNPYEHADHSLLYEGSATVDGKVVELTIKDINGAPVPLIASKELVE